MNKIFLYIKLSNINTLLFIAANLVRGPSLSASAIPWGFGVLGFWVLGFFRSPRFTAGAPTGHVKNYKIKICTCPKSIRIYEKPYPLDQKYGINLVGISIDTLTIIKVPP